MIEEYLIRRLESKTLSWSVVESLHDKIDFSLVDRSEAAFLREILANETIGVFVRGPLPG